MKKILTLLLLGTFALGLTGCDTSDLENKVSDLENQLSELQTNYDELDQEHQDLLDRFENMQEELNLYKIGSNPEVTMTIEGFGVIVIELFPLTAPNTVNSFIKNIQDGVFTDNEFHRVIEDFVIQGGASNVSCVIEAEVNNNPSFEGINTLSHTRGTISMARTQIYNSATTQFFIVHNDATFLNNEYAAFGQVVQGLDVLDAIAAVQTNASDQPLQTVVIESITVELFGVEYPDPVCE